MGAGYAVNPNSLYPNLLYGNNPDLKQAVYRMAEEVGAGAYERQMTAVANRADSRQSLGKILCPLALDTKTISV